MNFYKVPNEKTALFDLDNARKSRENRKKSEKWAENRQNVVWSDENAKKKNVFAAFRREKTMLSVVAALIGSRRYFV